MEKLTELKENDKVIFLSNKQMEVKNIKRVTPTQIVLEFNNCANQPYERKFRKDNGYEVGNTDSYYFPRIRTYNQEEMTQFYKEKRHNKLINIGLRCPDLETSEEVFEFLKSKNLIQ